MREPPSPRTHPLPSWSLSCRRDSGAKEGRRSQDLLPEFSREGVTYTCHRDLGTGLTWVGLDGLEPSTSSLSALVTQGSRPHDAAIRGRRDAPGWPDVRPRCCHFCCQTQPPSPLLPLAGRLLAVDCVSLSQLLPILGAALTSATEPVGHKRLTGRSSRASLRRSG
jgi:hypothetical protein